jgi:hypothetical protein
MSCVNCKTALPKFGNNRFENSFILHTKLIVKKVMKSQSEYILLVVWQMQFSSCLGKNLFLQNISNK